MNKLSAMISKFFNRPGDAESPAKKTGGIALVAVIVGMAFLGAAAAPAWAVALMWALASLGSGGVLGFLFGVPKVLQDQTKDPAGYRQVVNTNLDQISDWLTKVVVGLTLVNARDIAKSLQGTAQILAVALGGRPSHLAVAMATIVYFAVIGFLGTYILTRLYLAQAFYLGDQPPSEKIAKLLDQANAAEAAGRPDDAKKLRAQALAEAQLSGEAGA